MVSRRSQHGGGGARVPGTHTPRLDDKGRLFLPAKFREQLAEGLVVTRGQERCLYVFPLDEFAGWPSRCGRRRSPARSVRDYLRVFLSGAFDEVPDKQGRVTIPAGLRDYAGLDRDCMVIGAGRGSRSGTRAWDAYLEPSRSRRSPSRPRR